ncbi:MAG: DUF3658 domain-containing protein [Gammaproteobacteria bacterium]
MEEEIPIPDPPLSPEQEARVVQLTSKEIEAIDKTLMSNAKPSWRKVAMLVGLSIGQLRDRIPDIPDLYYSQRVRKLVESGRLESQGNLAYMRFSEVRLPEKQAQ